MRRATLLAALLLVSCPSDRDPDTLPGGPLPGTTTAAPRWVEAPEIPGLQMELSEDDPRGAGVEVLPAAETRVLSEAQTRALLARAPALEEAGDEKQAFALRPASQPPPRTGASVQTAFPPVPPGAVPEVAKGPLSVLRFAPEGDVPMAPHLSVTFDQPMVAVTSQEAAAKVRPVQISPEPRGQWRWIGTKTVLFEPTEHDRFPMATTYTVTVPAKTASAIGGTLSEAATWTFTTPPATVLEAWPAGGPHRRDPVVALRFDQAVDADAVAAKVTLKGREAHALRRATDAEIEADPTASAMVQRAELDRLVLLAPVEPLPAGTSFRITVSAGTPSAEGPNLTTEDQVREFRTYDPLRVEDTSCWENRDGTCRPGTQLAIRMNNPLDEERFDPEAVRIEPALKRGQVFASSQNVLVGGATEPHTTYTVTLPATLRDQFGQTLGAPATVRFQTGGLDPSLSGPSRDLLVLDPQARPVFPVFTVNHRRMRVRIYRALPERYGVFSNWMRTFRYDGVIQGEPPLERLADEVVDVESFEPDRMIETSIDLSPWLKDGKGQLVVWVEPKPQSGKRWEQIHLIHWVQSTDIGLSAYADNDDLLAWATDLSDGSPLEGVQVAIQGRTDTADARATGADGLATLPLRKDTDGPHVLVARRGDDVAILPQSWGWWNEYGGWYEHSLGEPLRWFVFDDRHMYRPGETVSVKGWIRRVPAGPEGDVEMPAPMPAEVAWVAYGPQGNELKRGSTRLSDTGGFDFSLDLPDTPNLGYARIDLSATGVGYGASHAFQIQEFRRPEFEVSASADPGPYVLGEHATFEVTAAYYAGGALPGADVQWGVSATGASYQPPGWEGFQFGEWVPWWRGYFGSPGVTTTYERLEGRTDATGAHRLGVDFLSANPPRPYTVSAEATVFDVNRQRWTASADILVHPCAWYVGLKPAKSFVRPGEALEVEAILVDIEGEPVAGQAVEIVLARLEWKKAGGDWKEVETDPVSCSVTTSEAPAPCSFAPEEGGAYRLRATIHDAEGRPNETASRVWVAGPTSEPMRGLEIEELTLVPDKEEYQPGDTARVLVQAPFSPAEGLYTLQREGLVEEHRFALADGSATLEIPITEAHLPGVQLVIDVVGSAERTDDLGQPLPEAPRRPAQAAGAIELKVPPRVRALSVEVTPREAALSPGSATVLDLLVKDASGRPVASEVAVVAVDEAVLALSGYRIPDPLEVFYQARGGGVSATHLRALLELARATELVSDDTDGALDRLGYLEGEEVKFKEHSRGVARPMAARAPMAPPPEAAAMTIADAASAPMGGAVAPPQPIALREDFSATALFAPVVQTGLDGRAEVPLDLPDSLTRYRIMAVAVEGAERFGTGESTVTARLPVMLRPSPPRFLNFGDRVEMPLVVQNQTDRPATVQVALQAVNAQMVDSVTAQITGKPVTLAGRETVVPANDRVEVRIPVAAYMAGKARFQAVIAAGDFADATRFELPVWTPATTEAFATYGVIDEGAIVQPVEAPADVWVQFGGLEVTTSSTTLQALTDAVLYLTQYPFECNEQISSRILAVAALRDVLAAFEAEQLPPAEELEAAVARDLERLKIRQLGNGGFSFWSGAGQDWPYPTVHVTHALVRAEAEGYSVDARMVARALDYLRAIERHIPSWYSDDARRSIIAYALFVRELAHDADPAKARWLIQDAGGVEGLSFEALGWILPTLSGAGDSARVAEILRHLGNNVAETAAGAHWVTGYDDGAYVLLHSDRRVDGVLLDSLIRVQEDSDLIPKVVQGLLAHRTRGRWGNTQENAFVLLAMHRYFETYESQTPDFVARVWLGDGYVGDHAFEGRTTEYAHTNVPMGVLSDPGGTRDLVIQRDGDAGRLYYRVGMRYAPRDLSYEAADYGFTVERVYEAIDDPGDVTRDSDGNWVIKAGARVRVRLTMVAPARRYHVMLVDPLPAGLEAQNPALATTGTLPEDPEAAQSRYWWWMRTWYEHQNLRDERVEAYASLVWDGVWTYSYVAAATTPGIYVVPPAKAEEMYTPETFGRSASTRVIVR